MVDHIWSFCQTLKTVTGLFGHNVDLKTISEYESLNVEIYF